MWFSPHNLQTTPFKEGLNAPSFYTTIEQWSPHLLKRAIIVRYHFLVLGSIGSCNTEGDYCIKNKGDYCIKNKQTKPSIFLVILQLGEIVSIGLRSALRTTFHQKPLKTTCCTHPSGHTFDWVVYGYEALKFYFYIQELPRGMERYEDILQLKIHPLYFINLINY
jgi:hypothetical protein